MIRALRTLLLSLLMVALPLQGLTAVVKTTCGSEHHAMPAAEVVHHHDQAGAVLHHHHLADHFIAAHDEVGPEHANEGTAKASTCSACATCCVGATAPPASISFTTEKPASAFIVVPLAVAFIGHIPASLERPPKHSLS